MPAVEKNYWRLPSGPAWAWWILAILPLDTQAQVCVLLFICICIIHLNFMKLFQQQVLSQVQLKKRLEAISRILGFIMRRSSNVWIFDVNGSQYSSWKRPWISDPKLSSSLLVFLCSWLRRPWSWNKTEDCNRCPITSHPRQLGYDGSFGFHKVKTFVMIP